MANKLLEVVVIGAGVVGLTTALKIQEKGGYAVTILAELLPTDPKSIKYTSHWAGAHHVSLAGHDGRQQKMDQETFCKMWELSAPGGLAEGCFLRLSQTEYYHEKRDDLSFLSWMPDFQVLAPPALHPETNSGVSFKTITIDSPVYLTWLLSRFVSLGGRVVKGTVQHVSQVVESGAGIFQGKQTGPPAAVVVCAGLGARTLGGIEDPAVHPIRGQTILLRAPWIRFGRTISSKSGLWTYIIPRRSGDVIIGGTKVENDWYPVPRKETTEDILQRAFALCPELAPPDIRAMREPTLDDVRPIIIEEGCGLRPGRTGNIRLETIYMEGSKVPVVCNYGHAGWGYQSSWGSASMALDLLEEALGKA